MDKGRQIPDDDLLFQLSEYLDGKLEGDALAAFEKQLAADRALRDELGAFQRVDALTRQYRATPPVIDWAAFGENVRHQREQRSAGPSRSFLLRLARPVAAAAALAFAVTAVIVFRPGTPTTTEGPTALPKKASHAWVWVNTPDASGEEARPAGHLSVSVSRALPDDALATVPAAPIGWALVVTSDEPLSGRPSGDSLF